MENDRCFDESDLFALLDEPEGKDEIAAHVASCAACSAKRAELEALVSNLREPVRAHDTDAFVSRLGERLTVEAPVRRIPRFRTALLVGSTVLAAAAMFVVVPRLSKEESVQFTARGLDAQPGAARDVAIELDLLGPSAQPVTAGTRAVSTNRLLVSFATRSAQEPYHLLCFAVDARSEVHWLYPAFEDAKSDPASVVLPPGRPSTAMPTEAALEDIPEGRVRVFAIVSSTPLHVRDIERLGKADLEAARFPGADVRSWIFSMNGPTEGGAL